MAARTAVEEEVGPGHEGSVPPAHGLQTEGGEGDRRPTSSYPTQHRRRWPPGRDGGSRRRRRRRRPPQAVTAAGAAVSGALASCRRLGGRSWWPAALTSTGGGGSGGGHVRPDRESAGPAPESADPAWRQLDLLRRNWEEKRSRRLEEEDGGGGSGAGGAEGMPIISVAQAHYTTIN
jgi:hypothetical protein